jgi:molybdopterin converting factor small subunit
VRVKVKLFARLRDLAGTGELDAEVAPVSPGAAATIEDVWAAVVRRHPALEPFGATMSCARNFEYSRWGTPVEEGDEIAFLPPVSGG